MKVFYMTTAFGISRLYSSDLNYHFHVSFTKEEIATGEVY